MKVLRNNSLKNLKTDDFIHIWDDVSSSCEEENKCDFSDLRLSKYNIIKHYSNGSIVINTLSESVIILSEQEKKWFQSFKSDDNLENKDFLQKLYNLGFLVKNETDELSLLYLITSQALRNPPKQLKVAINTTYKCNARCEYCFEYDSNKTHLSYEIADEIIDYICRTIRNDEKLTYRWFGGEPLVNPEIIDYIIDNVNSKCGDRLIYDGAILTNGTLFTDEIINKLVSKWHIREVHFTIDGYKETHNKTKRYTEDIDGYGIVLKNMKKLLPLVERVTCRVNVDKNNISEFEDIIKDLAPLEKYGNLNVYPAAVRAHNKDCLENCYEYSEYAHIFDYLYKIMDKYKLLSGQSILPVRKVICCSAKNVNEVVIGTNGKFYKCMQTSTYDQKSIGSCKTGLVMNEEMQKWIAPYWQDECKKCVFLPACQGGCKGYRELKNPFISPCAIIKYTILPVVNIIASKNGLI